MRLMDQLVHSWNHFRFVGNPATRRVKCTHEWTCSSMDGVNILDDKPPRMGCNIFWYLGDPLIGSIFYGWGSYVWGRSLRSPGTMSKILGENPSRVEVNPWITDSTNTCSYLSISFLHPWMGILHGFWRLKLQWLERGTGQILGLVLLGNRGHNAQERDRHSVRGGNVWSKKKRR